MASVNRVILIGNVGADPKINYMPNGDAVANFSVATTDMWKDKQGEKQERTEWHRIVCYRKLAEIAESYVKKGTPIYIEGHIASNEWTDKEGIKRLTTNIVTEQLRLLGSKGDNSTNNSAKDSTNNSAAPSGDFDSLEDDIPF